MQRTTATPPATHAPTATPAPATGAPPAPTAGAVAAGVVAAGVAITGTAALILPERAPEPPVLTIPSPVIATAPPPARLATSADAGSSTARLTDGLRVVFAAGKSDLTPDTAASLAVFAKAAPSGETTSFNVQAYAAGLAEDSSAARRLSLARALAIRTALMADGIASTRIYVRAMGTPADPGMDPVDRVDIAVLGSTARGQLSARPPARP
ncbi:MAG: hypothetical protein EXR01_06860 [Acetobacteraceae bacterium]|nr:hypothetical protein [Acetobacteraceae bacterium]